MIRSCDFRLTAGALCSTLVSELQCAGVDGATVQPFVVEFVCDQHKRMPDHLRLGIRVATLMFDLWSVLTTGKRIHRLSHRRRQHVVAGWRTSRFGILRDFVRFYETLAVFSSVSARGM